jgi:PAS domain S-box-containing protein
MTPPETNDLHNSHGPTRSIRTRMILWFAFLFTALVIAIVGVLTAGLPVLGVQGSLERERLQAFEHLNLIADLKKREINHWLEERVADIHVIASDPGLRGMSVPLAKDTGISSAEIQDLSIFFRKVQDTFGEYGGIYLLGAIDGRELFSVGEGQNGSWVGHPLVATALLTPGAVIGDVVTGTTQDKTSQFNIAHAILNKEERPIAILVVGIKVDHILPSLLHTGKGLRQSGEALLVNEGGQILTFLKHPLQDGSRAKPLFYRIQALPARLAAAGSEGIVESEDYRGVEVLAAFRHIRLNAEWGWGLVVKIDKAELFAPMKQEVRSALLVSLIGIAALLLLTLLISKRLTDPLRHLSNASSRLADGDLTTRSGLRGDDEIGFLGRAFDEMAGTIQKSMEISEAKHRTLVEETTAVVWTTNAEGGFASPQDSWEDYTGQPWEEHQGYGWSEMIHPDDRETFNTLWAEALKSRSVYKSDGRIWCAKMGEYRYFLARAVPLMDANSTVMEWIGTFSDTTAQRQNEIKIQALNQKLEKSVVKLNQSNMELSASYEFLDAIISESPVGISIYKSTGECVTVNQAIVKFIGASKPQMLDQNFQNLKSWKICGLFDAANLTLKSNKRNRLEINTKSTFDKHVVLDCQLVPFKTGEELNLLVMFSDISKNKMIEEQLRQAQKLEAIGTLAGGVAHDFNNILGIISGNAELASLGVSDTQDATKNILEASNRGAELVKQLLTIGRRTQTAKKLLDPELMIYEVLKLMRSTLPSSIEIRESIKGQGNKIFMDPTQLHQVLINLCSNAGQAMGEDGGVLEVTLEPITLSQTEAIPINASPGDYLQLMVRDTGPGISEEVQEHIFEPFFTTKEQGKGTGLGLSVVHSSLKECGGAIQVKSTIGKGSEFIVHLPIDETPLEAQSDLGSNNTIEKGSGRILFVDDEPGLVNVGVEMLKALGYSAIGATDPQSAIKTFMESPGSFDAVVTDQVMPGMAGNDLAARILDVRPDIPIFLCTGFSEKITEEKAAEIGFSGFFLKPVSIRDLSKALKKVIN